MLVYFLKGYLPWQNMIADNEAKLNLLVKEKKISIPVEVLCEGLPSTITSNIRIVRNVFQLRTITRI
jgi:casein kinase 1